MLLIIITGLLLAHEPPAVGAAESYRQVEALAYRQVGKQDYGIRIGC